MSVIGDLRKKEFRDRKWFYGEIRPGYPYRLILHTSLPNCHTNRVIILRKKDVKKMKQMRVWELHHLLRCIKPHPRSDLRKRKMTKIS